MQDSLKQSCDELWEQLCIVNGLKEQLKEAEAKYRMLMSKALELFTENEVDRIDSNGKQFVLKTKSYYSCKADKKQALYEYIKGVAPELFSINARTLDKYLRETVDTMPQDVKDLLAVYDEAVIKPKEL